MNKELIEISKNENLILIDSGFPKIVFNSIAGSEDIKSYQIKNFDENSIQKITLMVTFNNMRQLKETVKLYSNSTQEIKRYFYNDRHSLLRIEKTSRTGDFSSLIEYTYDEKNRLVKIRKGKSAIEIEFEYEGDKLKSKKEYKFQIGAEIIKKLTEVYEYEWSENRLIKIKRMDFSHQEIVTRKFVYNDEEKSVQSLLCFPDGEIKRIKYLFNKDFELVEKQYFYDNEVASVVKIDYNAGLKIRELALSNDERIIKNWEFDDSGNNTRYVRETNTGNLYEETFQYKYDKKGNWIEKLANRNGRIITSKRKIEYY